MPSTGQRIGVFPDIMILVHSMSQTKSIETQHRILSLVATLLGVTDDSGQQACYQCP